MISTENGCDVLLPTNFINTKFCWFTDCAEAGKCKAVNDKASPIEECICSDEVICLKLSIALLSNQLEMSWLDFEGNI